MGGAFAVAGVALFALASNASSSAPLATVGSSLAGLGGAHTASLGVTLADAQEARVAASADYSAKNAASIEAADTATELEARAATLQAAALQATASSAREASIAATGPMLKFAQTHVIDQPPKRFAADRTPECASGAAECKELTLTLVAEREALAIVEFGVDPAEVEAPEIRVVVEDERVDETLSLRPPSELPINYIHDIGRGKELEAMSEAQQKAARVGTPYSTTAFSVTIPAQYIRPGLVVHISTSGEGELSFTVPVRVPVLLPLVVVPFYLFGASHDTLWKDGTYTMTPENAGVIPRDVAETFKARVPASRFQSFLHESRGMHVDECLIYSGRDDAPPFRQCGHAPNHTGFDHFHTIGQTLRLLKAIRETDGTKKAGYVHYSSIVQEVDEDKSRGRKKGHYQGPGGGLGGGARGAGPSEFKALFYHEMGHGFGLPHAGGDTTHPYPNGGWKGSNWGYDQTVNAFFDPFIHGWAANRTCATAELRAGRPIDEATGQCYKNDPMQGGGGHMGGALGAHSDYYAAVLQQRFEGQRRNNWVVHEFFPNSSQAKTYVRYRGEGHEPEYLRAGIAGWTDWRYPAHVDVNKTVVVFTLSGAQLGANNVAGPLDTKSFPQDESLQYVYRPLEYKGSALLSVDAADAAALKRVWPFASYKNDRPEYGWCSNGCDFVIRLTYENNVMKQYLTRHSFKHWMWPLRAPKEDWVTNDIKSFKIWSIGVPNDGVSVKRVDILHAPRAWLGLHARNPQVITSWVKGVGEVVPEEKYASTDDFAESSVEVTVQRSAGTATCAAVPTLDDIFASEKVVFDTLMAENLLPTGTRVRVSCVCPGGKCFDGCERAFMYDVPKEEPLSPMAVEIEAEEETEDAEDAEETHMEIEEETHMDAANRRLLTTDVDTAEDDVDEDYEDFEDFAALGASEKYWTTVYYKCAHYPRTSRFFEKPKNAARCETETEADGASQIAKKCGNAKFRAKYEYQCANGLQGPLIEPATPAPTATPAPAASANSVQPQCGCTAFGKFDVEARTCKAGTVPASALTKAYVATGVYYLKDADGVVYAATELGTRSLEIYGKDVRVGADATVEEVAAACRAQDDCAAFSTGNFNPAGKGRGDEPRFFSNKCASPCYRAQKASDQDKPGAQMVYHFDDFPNPWDKYAAGEDTGDDATDVAVTLRFAIRGPAAAVAAAADAFPRASAKNAHFAAGFKGFVPPDVHHSVVSSALGAAASYDAAAATKRASSSSSRRLSAASYAVTAFGVASAIAAVAHATKRATKRADDETRRFLLDERRVYGAV